MSTHEYLDFVGSMKDNNSLVATYRLLPVFRGTYSTGAGALHFPPAPDDTMRRVLLEAALSRNVETFLFYLTEVLRHIFTQNRGVLVGFLDGAEKKVEISEVLKSQDMPAFIKLMADKSVDELAYKGLAEIMKHLNTRMKLGYDADNPDFLSAKEAVEVRNIIAHNAGRVSHTFLRRTGKTAVQEGVYFPLDLSYLDNASKSLMSVAGALDKLFVTKFHVAN